MRILVPLPVLLAIALAGCASFHANVVSNGNLRAYRHFFVQTNTNDDHKVGSMIAGALLSHGFDATHGPITMMPEDTQVIVSYDDRWTWDFKNHMTALRIVARGAIDDKPIATASFQGAAAMNVNASEVVARLVEKILVPPSK